MGSIDTTDDDATLLRRAVGDDAALGTLYRRYVRRVTAFAARRCVSADDVADAVAETFDRLLRSAHRYDATRGSVVSFVFAVADSPVDQAGYVSSDPDTGRIDVTVTGTAGVEHIEYLARTPGNLALLVPPVPAGYTQVDDLAPNEVREAGCVS